MFANSWHRVTHKKGYFIAYIFAVSFGRILSIWNLIESFSLLSWHDLRNKHLLKIRQVKTKRDRDGDLNIMRKTLQHSLNPLHIYCRLLKLGFPKSVAISIARFYERAIFTLFSGTLYRYSRKPRTWVISSWPVFETFQKLEFDECHPTSTPKNEPWGGRKPPKVIVKKGSVRWHSKYFSDMRASFHSVILTLIDLA